MEQRSQSTDVLSCIEPTNCPMDNQIEWINLPLRMIFDVGSAALLVGLTISGLKTAISVEPGNLHIKSN